jgi:TetR/AcrR family transcriptional regulator
MVDEASDGPAWQSRVVNRSLKRAEQVARDRTRGPTNRIVQAAIELANETGGASFTLQQVVDRAGVALQTFYRYFGSKDELMLAFVEETSRAENARIATKAQGAKDPLERLRIIIMTPFRTANRAVAGSLGATMSRELRRLRDNHGEELATVSSPYLTLLEDAVNDAAKAGLIDPEDAARDAQLILGMVEATFLHTSQGFVESDLDEAEAYVWRFCLRALNGNPRVLKDAGDNDAKAASRARRSN